MPKDNIERAIQRGAGGGGGDAFERIVYEGYGPDGVAVIVEALTDNRNRTAADVRNIFTKHGGSLAQPGAVAWIFERKGSIVVDGTKHGEDDVMTAAIEAGAEDVVRTATSSRYSPSRATSSPCVTRSRRRVSSSSRPS